MANHFSTTIKILGKDADVAEVMTFVKETEFDFNKIIPMPDNLGPQWADWRYDNWGTRNEAIGIEIEGNEVYYETVNGAAIPILEHISKLYPNVKIEVSFLDRLNLQGYDGIIQAGDVIECEFKDYYPYDEVMEYHEQPASEADTTLNQSTKQEQVDDDLPF